MEAVVMGDEWGAWPTEVWNTASFGKWAQLQKSWRLFWPWRDLQACAEELLQPQAQKVVEAHNKIKHKR